MREARLVNLTRGTVLAETAAVAETPASRRRGLLGTASLPAGSGLLIVPCRQVHTFGMAYTIDVVFVDEAWNVKRVVHDMKPGRLGALVPRARAALELPAGKAAETGTVAGDMLDARDIAVSSAGTRPAIDHINRYVVDVGKHIAFYTEALGYEVIGRGVKADGSAYAILKGHEHELFISERPQCEAAERAARHIGYTVKDAGALLQQLQESGMVGEETKIIVKEYSRQFYLEDPDGNEIDFIQWTDKRGFYDDLDRGR
jgi:uncharacterized membrane protein (UPF0127 family)/catechol 2,3-dioxygenase-like lactoylglutathione lyase family enzyme